MTLKVFMLKKNLCIVITLATLPLPLYGMEWLWNLFFNKTECIEEIELQDMPISSNNHQNFSHETQNNNTSSDQAKEHNEAH